MRKRPHLVSDYLEDLSGDILDFPEVVENFVTGRHGIYALYEKGHLYYVGLAKNLKARLKQHQKDRHAGLWDRFSVFLTTDGDHLKDLESLLLRVTKKPKGNKVNGKFNGAKNRNSELQKEFAKDQKFKLRRMFNLSQKTDPIITNSEARKRSSELSPTMALRAFYKDKVYKAMIRKDGSVRVGSKIFSSLSSAATSVTGHPTNGHWFWWAKDRSGEWARLNTFKV